MRFLVDAQLPPALARFLATHGHQAEHVFDIGMEKAEDRAIWDYAIHVGAVVVTKDEDFANRIAVDPAAGPPIVWIRMRNTTKQALLRWFEPLLPRVSAALTAGEKLIEMV
jgi:predicted nuclease of predicted toxin-antitoxin system